MIVDHVVVVVVVAAAGVAVVLAFVIDAAAAEFDVVISADVSALVFHLVVVIVLFVIAASASEFKNDNVDVALACYFLEIFADSFGDRDYVVQSAVCRLHLAVLLDPAVFL